MGRLSHFFCFICLAATATAGFASDCPPPAPSTQNPLNPAWRAAAYPGLVSRLNPRPKSVQNVKFLFLGEPVPAAATRSGGVAHGYGGLVAMRWKSVLWLVKDTLHFYLVDPEGNVLMFYNIEYGDRNDVTPKFYDVRIDRGSSYERNPNYWPVTYDGNGMPIPGTGSIGENEYIWVDTEEKVVEPVLDPYWKDALRSFRRTPIGNLPTCQ